MDTTRVYLQLRGTVDGALHLLGHEIVNQLVRDACSPFQKEVANRFRSGLGCDNRMAQAPGMKPRPQSDVENDK